MKALFSLGITIALIASVQFFIKSNNGKKVNALYGHKPVVDKKAGVAGEEKRREKGVAAKAFVKSKGYNTQFCFLIDMSLASGDARFIVYDLRKDSILHAGPVTHGNCFQNWLEGRKYSNAVGCGCTSLGRYRVGIPYTGQWGYAYKLHGLDSSNSNAFERAVVLHSHSCVPEQATEDEICQSNGCPTISPGLLQKIKPMLNHSEKPVLLWIYE